jgi:hypothetical protein
MTLKNSPAELITTIKIKFVALTLLVLFCQKSSAQTCTQESNKVLIQNLVNFLGKPTAGAAKGMASDLCKAFSGQTTSGPHTASCLVSFSDEVLSKFAAAAQTIPEMIPVIKCAASAADLSSAQDLNELQASLLDQYKDDFFKKWDLVKEATAQKPENFALQTPFFSDDLKSSQKIYETRLALIDKAPSKLKSNFKIALALLKEEISILKKRNGEKNDEGEVTFKISRFREHLAKKLKNAFDLAVATVHANELILDEGLNFRAQLKTDNRNWKVCSASTSAALEGSCHVMAVDFEKVSDPCQTYGVFGLLFQAGGTWVVMSGSSSYRLEISDLLTPVALNLNREKALYHGWNLPEGFTPEFLTGDLHTVYARTTIYSEDGKRLGALHLVLRDNGRFQFTELPKDQAGNIRITGREGQQIKSMDGSFVEIYLPKLTCGHL